MGHYFELLATRKYSIFDEASKIYTLFSQESLWFGEKFHTVQDYIDKKLFRKWKYCDTFLSTSELFTSFSVGIYPGMKMDTYLLYSEIVYNLTSFCKRSGTLTDVSYHLSRIMRNIEIVVGNFNYEVVKDDDKYIIVEKNAAATRAVDIVDTQSANRIYEYNHFLLRGNVAKKGEILSQLAKTIEPYRAALDAAGYKSIYSDTTFLLNSLNIRHAAINGPEKAFIESKSHNEIEKLYDDAYDLILSCIVLFNSIKTRQTVTEVKSQMGK